MLQVHLINIPFYGIFTGRIKVFNYGIVQTACTEIEETFH